MADKEQDDIFAGISAPPSIQARQGTPDGRPDVADDADTGRSKEGDSEDDDADADDLDDQDDDGEMDLVFGDEDDDDDGESDEDDDDDGESEEDDDDDGESEEEDQPRKKTAKTRIAEITKARRAAERQRDAAEVRIAQQDRVLDEIRAELKALKEGRSTDDDGQGDAKQVKVTDRSGKELKEPDPADYDYGEVDKGYLADVVTYNTAKALAEDRAAEAEERQSTAAGERLKELQDGWEKLGEAGESLFSDFSDIVVEGAKAKQWQLGDTIAELAPKSEVGAQVIYNLARNPKESARVAGLSPMEQAAYFGRMEAKFLDRAQSRKAKDSKRAAPKASAPPKRRQTRGSGGKFERPSASKDFAAFEAHVMSQEGKK